MTEIEATEKKKKNTSRLDGGTLFWGSSLILLGGLFLLRNLGIVDLHLSNIWQLWPLIIIGIGLSYFNLRGAWGIAIKTLAIIASLALILFATINEQGLRINSDTNGQQSTVRVLPSSDDIDSLDVRIDTGALNVNVDASSDESLLADASLTGRRTIAENTRQEGTTQYTTFSTEGSSPWSDGENRLNLLLTKELPTKLTFDMGASSIKGDLSEIQLTDLTIDTGASSVDLKLGDRQDTLNVLIDSGASSIKLHIPKHVAYQVNHDGGLSSRNFEEASKISKRVYQTDDFDTARQKIVIRADTGLSSFKIERY